MNDAVDIILQEVINIRLIFIALHYTTLHYHCDTIVLQWYTETTDHTDKDNCAANTFAGVDAQQPKTIILQNVMFFFSSFFMGFDQEQTDRSHHDFREI